MADIMVRSAPAVWIVTTYNTRELAVREWACRYPLLLASTFEGFRLHYAPDAHHFLTQRAGAAELRAMSAALGENLTMRAGANDTLFLGEGWSAADVVGDRTYRWATSTSATLSVPRWGRRDRTIAFIAAPMPPQTMQVALNGAILGKVTMRGGWQRYEFAAPASTWRDGSNDVELTFAHTAMAPNDPRTLAVLFDEISIGAPSEPAFIPPLRMPADELLQTHRDKAEPVDRARVEALLARLGLDPAALWPAIARGDVALQDAVNTLAWGPDCEADDAFLDRAFVVLMHRHPGTFEQRDLLGRLKGGATREQILARITRAGEFHAAISSASHAPPHPDPIRR
jgi:hypothetical protein